MILAVTELKTLYPDKSNEQLERKIKAIESAIRAHTNNTFRKEGVDYWPPDVIEGALSLIDWDWGENGKKKTGIKSESLSRKSTTYADVSEGNSESGYPIGLMGFLRPYMKMRF